MRPTYESEADRSNEQAVVDRLCARWKVTHQRLPMTYKVDYVLVGPRGLRLWLEVKCRSNWYDEGMKLSINKIIAGQQYAKETGLPFVVAFAVRDDIRLALLSGRALGGDGGLELSIWGNAARNDGQDIEVAATIPMEMLIPLDKM